MYRTTQEEVIVVLVMVRVDLAYDVLVTILLDLENDDMLERDIKVFGARTIKIGDKVVLQDVFRVLEDISIIVVVLKDCAHVIRKILMD